MTGFLGTPGTPGERRRNETDQREKRKRVPDEPKGRPLNLVGKKGGSGLNILERQQGAIYRGGEIGKSLRKGDRGEAVEGGNKVTRFYICGRERGTAKEGKAEQKEDSQGRTAVKITSKKKLDEGVVSHSSSPKGTLTAIDIDRQGQWQ